MHWSLGRPAVVALLALTACERTPTGLTDEELELQLGSYSVAVIGSTADLTVVGMDSLGRVAGNFTAGGGFRWSNGSLVPLPQQAAGFVVAAANNRGDLAGMRDGKPGIIFAESSFVSVLTGSGDPIPTGSEVRFLNDRREVILAVPYGLSGMDQLVGMWRAGTYKPLSVYNQPPYSKPVTLNNRGTAILQFTYTYPSWFALASPFDAGPAPSNACRSGRYSIAYALNDSAHTISRDEVSKQDGFISHDFLFANGDCTDLTLSYPELSIRWLNNLGLLGGTATGKAFLAMGGASVALERLLPAGWQVATILRINDRRQVLTRAVGPDAIEKWVVLSPASPP